MYLPVASASPLDKEYSLALGGEEQGTRRADEVGERRRRLFLKTMFWSGTTGTTEVVTGLPGVATECRHSLRHRELQLRMVPVAQSKCGLCLRSQGKPRTPGGWGAGSS